MLLRSLRLRGIGPFRREVHVDLANLPRIVAVVGPNGAGKSTLLGSFVAALERAFPDDDPFVDGRPLARLATSRDAFLEAEVLNGSTYRICHLVDAVSGKGESVVRDAEGKPLVHSSKVSEFDRWRAEHLPAREVLLTSIFAAQGSGGFLDMTSGQRKSVVLRTLGIEKYEALAAAARSHAADARNRLDSVVSDIRLQAERGGPAAMAVARKKVEEDEQLCSDTERTLADCRERLERRRVEHAAAASAAREGAAARERHLKASDRVTLAARQVRELERKITEQRETLATKDRVDAAVARVAELDVEVRALEDRSRGLEEDAKVADVEASAASSEWTSARDELARIEARMTAAAARVEDLPRIQEAERALPGAREVLARAEQDLAAARAEVDRVAGLKVAGAEERIAGLRNGLGLVLKAPTIVEGAHYAKSTLHTDDAAVKAADEVPELDRKVRNDRDRCDDAVALARQTIQRLERAAARLPEVVAAAQDLAQDERAAAERRQSLVAIEDRRKAASKRAEEARATARVERDALLAKRHERGRQWDDAHRAPVLVAAAARLEAFLGEAEVAKRDLEEAQEALRLAPDPGAPVQVPDLVWAERDVSKTEEVLRQARDAKARSEGYVASLEEVARQVLVLEGQREVLEAEHSDFSRLAEDWGRKGIQALEIDAAGPELSAIVNDLLSQAFGPRYTVGIETTRPREKDGEPIEVFDLRVIDGAKGYEGDVGGLSGGQRTIVGEAMRLALTTLATRRHGFGELTLVRDESGAALDQENGPAWVAMLRRAADLVGAKQVLFVTHDPSLAALADARVRVGQDGTVSVE